MANIFSQQGGWASHTLFGGARPRFRPQWGRGLRARSRLYVPRAHHHALSLASSSTSTKEEAYFFSFVTLARIYLRYRFLVIA